MEDITVVTVHMDGLEVIASRLLIGVKALLVKTMQDVLNKELHSTATVQEDGLESFVMCNKCHVRLPLKTEVYPDRSYAKMEAIAKTLTTEPTAMNVYACLVLREAIVKRTLMSALQIHVKTELSAEI